MIGPLLPCISSAAHVCCTSSTSGHSTSLSILCCAGGTHLQVRTGAQSIRTPHCGSGHRYILSTPVQKQRPKPTQREHLLGILRATPSAPVPSDPRPVLGSCPRCTAEGAYVAASGPSATRSNHHPCSSSCPTAYEDTCCRAVRLPCCDRSRRCRALQSSRPTPLHTHHPESRIRHGCGSS